MKRVYACDACEFVTASDFLAGSGHMPVRDGKGDSCFYDCPGEVRAFDARSPTGVTLNGRQTQLLVERDAKEAA